MAPIGYAWIINIQSIRKSAAWALIARSQFGFEPLATSGSDGCLA